MRQPAAGNGDDLGGRRTLLHFADGLDAFLVRHQDVGDDDIGLVLVHQPEPLLPVLGLEHVMFATAEGAHHQLAHVGVIVDYQKYCHRWPPVAPSIRWWINSLQTVRGPGFLAAPCSFAIKFFLIHLNAFRAVVLRFKVAWKSCGRRAGLASSFSASRGRAWWEAGARDKLLPSQSRRGEKPWISSIPTR